MSDIIEKNLNSVIERAINEAIAKRGKVNILIAGDTGVGKSTLVNAVFQGNLATTGDGLPVTRATREITKEGIPLTIFDTRGIEKGSSTEMIKELEAFVRERQKREDAAQHIHVAWICILEASRRIEPADIELTDMLNKYIPVVAVITKAISDEGFRRTVQELLPHARNVVRVHARETVLEDGYVIKAKGLEDLVDLTMNLVPEGVRNALIASQRVSMKMKLQRAHAAVGVAAAAASGVGVTPIPFADAVLIIPTQIGMLATISAIWGIPVSQVFLGTIISGTLTSSLGTIGGRALASSLLKFIPGIGSVVGAVITAGVAGTLTTLFGEAYIATLYQLTKDDPDKIPEASEIRDEFRRQLHVASPDTEA